MGTAVRKPATKATAAAESLLVYLTEAGFDGSPRSLGRDEAGRHVLRTVSFRSPPGATRPPTAPGCAP